MRSRGAQPITQRTSWAGEKEDFDGAKYFLRFVKSRNGNDHTEGSPAQLLAADADDEGDDAPVSIHEPADDDDEDDAEQAPPTPEQLTPEEKEERRKLIRKIGRYQALFGKDLTDITTTGLDSMTLAALRDLATDVEFLVGTRHSA